MTNWRRSPRVAVGVTVVFLVVMIAIPVSRLGDHEFSQRFGWQMFSVDPVADFTVHRGDDRESVSLPEHLARVRADLNLEVVVPPFLCVQIDGADKVTWDGGSYPCGPG